MDSDAFGKRGRKWLASLELAVDERLTLDGCLRQIDLLDVELARSTGRSPSRPSARRRSAG